MNKPLLLICFFSITFIQHTNSQHLQEIKTITQMLHNFMEGASNNDQETHDNFWAEDLIYTSSNGTRFGKAEIMAGFENKTEDASTPKTIFTAEEIQINVYNDMAIVAFKMKGTSGDAVQYYYNSGTFLKQNGRWRVVNWQATIIP